MRKIIGWIALFSSFIAASISATGILYTHLQPAIDAEKLLDLTRQARPVVIYVLVFTVVVSTITGVPWMWGRLANRKISDVLGPDPWYVQLSAILFVPALIDTVYTFFTKYAPDTRLAGGKWVVCENFVKVPEAQAILFLWANLRVYCGSVFMLALICFIMAYTMLARAPWTRDGY